MRSPFYLISMGKCPTPGCNTKLNKVATDTYECPKCLGKWMYVVYTPFDAVWRVLNQPIEKIVKKQCTIQQKTDHEPCACCPAIEET